MDFTIIGPIRGIETTASGRGVRERIRLDRAYGRGQWLKRKGVAEVRLRDGTFVNAEVHWYEANGIGKREFKIKFIDF